MTRYDQAMASDPNTLTILADVDLNLVRSLASELRIPL